MRAHRHGRAAWGRRLVSAALALLAALACLSCGGKDGPKERVVDLGGGVKMTLVLIPAGTFTMGSTEEDLKAVRQKWPEVKEEWIALEKPAHKVTISRAFWMGKYEVTVGQFRRFVEATGFKTFAGKVSGSIWATGATEGGENIAAPYPWRKLDFKQTDEHPVVCVDWNDARAFADWLNATDKAKPAGANYRLPTEAEWEYACRGSTTTWYQWGDDPNYGEGWCNAADATPKEEFPDVPVFNRNDGFLYTAPVGSFKVNAFGLYDMHGNALEWCQDWGGPYSELDQSDPTGPASGERLVLRGGSWRYLPINLRCACRIMRHPADGYDVTGFRLVLAPGP